MKCSRAGCQGVMYRFRPKHLVGAWYRTGTDVVIRLDEPEWKQIGLMCDTCGCMEFFAQDPREALSNHRDFFERTEEASGGNS